jgi:cobalt transport protein ATP-binding subunit
VSDQAHAHLHDHSADDRHGHRHVHEERAPGGGGAEGGTIEVEHLHFRYPDGTEALTGIDLRVGHGEKVAIVGPNGAGKSTLLLHLNGIHAASHGSVRIGGVVVDRGTVRRIRARVGLVFQDPDDQLFSPTVFDDVAFGPLHMGMPRERIHDRVEAALASVGMSGSEARVPHRLSLGQRKRVAMATVLSMEPDILVFDEPTAGLDPRGRRALIQLLSQMPQTLLVSTHDMPFVAEAFARTVVLDGGRIVADGPTDRMLVDGPLLEAHGLERP